MTSTYVSIGRNIGDEPMSADAWRDFRAATVDAVETFAGPVVSETEGTGRGPWGTEQCAIIVGASAPSIPTGVEFGLYSTLARLARRFGQDAIAVGVAPVVDFVRGSEGQDA